MQVSINISNPSVNRTLSIIGQHDAERTLLKGRVAADVFSGVENNDYLHNYGEIVCYKDRMS